MRSSKLTLLLALTVALQIPTLSYAQTTDADTAASEPEDGYTLANYSDEEDASLYTRTFWSLEFGPSFPIGSSEAFYIPTNIIGVNPPEPYANFFREGYTINIATGIMTDLGFEASLSFRITKVNYNNRATAQILADTRALFFETTYSSYIIGTQVYLGQRLKPISEREESLYFGVGMELGALKHYSSRISAADKGTFALSVIVGDEIPIQRDPKSFAMLTLRIQAEFVAMANQERPRFLHLTFGIRGYLP